MSLEAVLGRFGAREVPAMDVYSDVFRLGDGFIQQDGEPGGMHKGNPIALGSFDGRVRRRILFEDTFEETLAEMQGADWAITNGLTYFGKANTADNQSKMCAMIFDLDGQTDETLSAFLGNIHSDYPLYPEPNYIVLSGHNVHLYYVFEQPIALYPHAKTLLKDLKYHLTDRIWNPYTSTEEVPQHQGINQGFRVIGGRTKDGGRVRAFRVNEHPFSLEELNGVLPEDQRADLSSLAMSHRESRYTLDDAREKFPEWYERVIVCGDKATGKWVVKEDLYEWWLRKVREGATFRHRYFCLMALAIFAVKCGITDRDRVRADMESLVPFLNSIKADDDKPFGADGEVRAALECFDLRYATFPRKDLERITAIAMPQNKRNYRKQNLHLRMARSNLAILSEDAGHALQGRPKDSGTKREQVWAYLDEHPDATQREAASALGMSPATVNKWAKARRDEWGPKRSAPTSSLLCDETKRCRGSSLGTTCRG